MVNVRSTRDNEMVRSTRENEKRDNNRLMQYSMGYVNPLDLPEGLAKDGYRYYWAAREIAGKPTFEVEEMCARGWELVPKERCTSYNFDPLKRHPFASQYICYNELILLERPEIYSLQEEAARYTFNNHRINSLEGVKNDAPYANGRPLRTIGSF